MVMGFMENWGELLAPTGGFKVVDLWQVLVVLVLLVIYKCIFRKYQEFESAGDLTPKLWIRFNLPFIAQWATLLAFYLIASLLAGFDTPILRFFAILGAAWVAIGIITSLLKERFWSQSVAAVAYLVTGLFGLNLVEETIRILDDMSFSIGDVTISAWKILGGIIAFIITLWVGLAVARLAETQIQHIPRLSASLKVLIAKIVRIALIAIAIITAIGSIGIDLSAFAFLGGAIGIGLGFGLQKVVSNFVSGIILLTDNSIKPGDVIEIEGTYGWINNLRARYASVITRDGTEHLIPNEDLITQRVINWSFTDNLVRVRVKIGVAYNSDPHQCIALIKEAAASVPRVLDSPEPNCLLRGFGDSSIDLELRFWIADPSNGVGNMQSAVLLAVWDTLKENNIEIPFPQRDLHIRSSDVDFVKHDNVDPE
ncbi:MAG: mechanosensitive ion channel family protein [Lentimonas sp.]